MHTEVVVRDRLGRRRRARRRDAHRSQCRRVDAEDLVVEGRGEAAERSARGETRAIKSSRFLSPWLRV